MLTTAVSSNSLAVFLFSEDKGILSIFLAKEVMQELAGDF